MEPKTKTLSCKIPTEFYEAIKTIAEQHECSMNHWMKLVLLEATKKELNE